MKDPRRFFKKKKKEKKQPHYPLRKGDVAPKLDSEVRMSANELAKCQSDPYYYYKNYLRPPGHKLMSKEEFKESVEKYKKERDAVMPKDEQEKLKTKMANREIEKRGGVNFEEIFDNVAENANLTANQFKPKDADGNIIEPSFDEEEE